MIKPYIYTSQLVTRRLFTRFLTVDDIPVWADFFKDEAAVEFFPPSEFITHEARAAHWVNRQLIRYNVEQCGLQALIHKDTKEFIGQCGLIKQLVDGKKELEVGYHIFKKYWGHGYAPEAAGAFIGEAFIQGLTSSVIAIIGTENTRSQAVAVKNGLVKDRQTIWMDMDVFIYRIHKNEWL